MLTDAAIRRLKPGPKPYKKGDALGLYVLVNPNGSKLLRRNYTFGGVAKTRTYGVWPIAGLAEARERRDEDLRLLRQGIDPGAVVKVEKVAKREAAANTFGAVAADWLRTKMVKEGKSKSTLARARWLLAMLKDLDDRPIGEIGAPELLKVLRQVEAQGKLEGVKRLRTAASAIFRFGIASGLCDRDPAADLKGALTTARSTPLSAITDPTEVGKLLRAIDAYDRPVLRMALLLAALTAARPGNIASAEWAEFDIAAGVWSIPKEKMKMRREPLRVPLSRQALAVLAELHKITGHSKFLFPSLRKGNRPIFTYALNTALRKIGYTADQAQAHGFRSTFSSLANEHSDFSIDAIELSLAHAPRGVRGIYNRSQYWAERCKLMQWYADYICELRDRGEVVALPAVRGGT
jgi:integrase